jgi:hypothetical protein
LKKTENGTQMGETAAVAASALPYLEANTPAATGGQHTQEAQCECQKAGLE